MLVSMTGYGRGLWQGTSSQIQVELRSVNSRYLNLKFRMPDGLLRFENILETKLRQALGRGSVTCQVQWKRDDSNQSFNTEKLMDVFHKIKKLSLENNLPSDINLGQLALLPEVSAASSDFIDDSVLEEVGEGLNIALEQALEEINAMRCTEGAELKKQMLSFSKELGDLGHKVAEKAPTLSKNQQAKLMERINKLRDDIEFSEADLSRELAVLADRSDISEEVTRLDSHLVQLANIMDEGGLVGRKLDFVLQEVNREINTMGSKSSCADLSKLVVEMKAVAEKIREQVQNIE